MDKGASIIAKLKNKAKETGKPLQVHLQLFCRVIPVQPEIHS